MVYKTFDKITSGGTATLSRLETLATRNKSAIENENTSNKELAEELRKLIIRKFKERKVHSSFTDSIWGADLADMQLISKFNKGFRFLLSVTDIFSKYAWVIPLKDKKWIAITYAFHEVLDESNRKSK